MASLLATRGTGRVGGCTAIFKRGGGPVETSVTESPGGKTNKETLKENTLEKDITGIVTATDGRKLYSPMLTKVSMGSVKTLAILDTGASISLISKSCLSKVFRDGGGRHVPGWEGGSVKAAHGRQLNIIGKVSGREVVGAINYKIETGNDFCCVFYNVISSQ